MYEIIEWKSQYGNNLQVQYQQVSLEAVFNASTDLSSIPGWDESENEGIDIIDVEFTKKVKAADREAYLFAMFSGVTAGMIDYAVVGKTDYKAIFEKIGIDLKNLDQKQIQKLLTIIAGLNEFNNGKLAQFSDMLNQSFAQAQSTVKQAPEYKAMVLDFANGMSVRALVTNIVCRLIGFRVGLDKDGSLTFEKIDDPEFDKLSLSQKIRMAFSEWFLMQVETYRATKKFENEVNGLFAFKRGIEAMKAMVKETANLKLFKDGTIDRTKAYSWFKDKMLADESDDELILLKELMVKQAIPVVINKAMIRTYMFVDKFNRELKEKDVKSIEGLEFINPAYMDEDDRKKCDLLEGVSGLIFETMDLAGAGLSATKAGMTGGGAAALYAFATEVNFVNICNLVAICRRNKDEILDAVKNRIPKEKFDRFVKADNAAREERGKLLQQYLTLNKIETKILYSLELQIVEEDIKATKDSETQVKKNKWKKQWMKASRESTEMERLFYSNSEKLYAMINTKIGNDTYDGWLHQIALEISLFVPYFPLGPDDKEYTGLKLANKKYVEEEFCSNQNLITKGELKSLRNTYKKYHDALDHKQEKAAAGVVGTVAVAAGAAVAAYTFAPVIAVAVAGHFFTGLYGAALTNASLALLGGGAIAAGGMGMAGGTLVIAGGGAILGMGVSGGMTATAMLLLSSSSYVRRDQAKLLTSCDYKLKHAIITKDVAEKIAAKLGDNVNEVQVNIAVRKGLSAQNKEYKKANTDEIKELEQSCKYMENSKALILKMAL